MGWGLVEPIDAQPSRGYCDDGREINFVARDVIYSEINSTEGLNCGMDGFVLKSYMMSLTQIIHPLMLDDVLQN